MASPYVQTTSSAIDAVTSRNATQINLAIALANGSWARVGRVQSINEDVSNNVQVLMELGSQVAVELKKGITTYTFSISKMYVHSDIIDQLIGGQVFGLQLADSTASAGTILEQFSQCSINTVSRAYSQGQATVAQNATVVAINKSQGSPD